VVIDKARSAVDDPVADGVRCGVVVHSARHPAFDEVALEAR